MIKKTKNSLLFKRNNVNLQHNSKQKIHEIYSVYSMVVALLKIK